MSLDSVRDRAETLNQGTKHLLAELDRLVLFSRDSFEQRWQDTESFKEPGRELSRQLTCDDYRVLLLELSQTLLPALEGAESSRVPVELEPLVERLVREAGGTDLNVVLFSDDNFNYSIQRYPEPVVYLAPRMARRAQPPTPNNVNFLFLRLPRLERDSAALHAVMVGHELGHLRDWLNNLSGDLDPPYPVGWVDAVTNNVKSEYQGLSQFYRDLIFNWAGELVADIYAALLLGPASLLALSEVVLTTSSFDFESDTHPATDRRTALILDVLDESRFDQVLELEGLMLAYREASSGADTRPVDVYGMSGGEGVAAAQAAWDWLRGQLPALVVRCKSALGTSTAIDAASWPRVRHAADQFMRGRPCGELLRSVASDGNGRTHVLDALHEAEILNAAWFVRQQNFTGLAGMVDLDAAQPAQAGQLGGILDGLVLKSLEIAEIRRMNPWSQAY